MPIKELNLQAMPLPVGLKGKLRVLTDGEDNITIERPWRFLNYECVYLKEFQNGKEVRHALAGWFNFYNHRRPHFTFDGDKPMNRYSTSLNTSSSPQKYFSKRHEY
ncbi:integrase core domain-containing protein [Halodesulfovibrio marinisediminis]|uniref:integrase core domain-containing protein n=1 Tax=Halodesulfovibrio marinisediminis TaxID=458711 RepID=UPI001587FE18|nr:integrase core domain-containing protein [Halodesulfovibrio marinisediminis]